MRLIDADAFDALLRNAQAECKKNGGNFRFGVLGSVRANLANTPAVDAIPVEWLRDKMMERQTLMTKNPYGYVLAEWLEQEAR